MPRERERELGLEKIDSEKLAVYRTRHCERFIPIAAKANARNC